MPTGTPTPTPLAEEADGGFAVHLDVFSGPFDLLLRLIAKSKLDVTEVALAEVTDEFLAHLRAGGDAFDLDEASEFLVVAATLVDLKAARLLPRGEVEDEEDVARLEARDLLFARLMQYRAYRAVAAFLAERMAAEGRRYPRAASLEPRYAELLPDVSIGLEPAQFAALAARVLTPRPAPVVATDHLHRARISVAEQVATLAARLRTDGPATFQALIADSPGTLLVVARFLALLDLYRDGGVRFDQFEPLGSLMVTWTGPTTEDET